MKMNLTKLVLSTCALLVATVAYGQNTQLVSHTMFAQLEQELSYTNTELSDVKARLASLEDGEVAPAVQKGGDCCCDCWCNPCCGWIGSAEILFLRPHDNYADSTSSNRYETGSRYMIGHMDECGRSWRLRYFEFYHPDFDGSGLQMETLDAEYAGRFTLGCNWRGELSAGLRWAEYRDDSSLYSETIGPVIGAEVRNCLWCDVDIFALARQSIQFGEQDNDESGTFSITELQVGLEVTRCVAGTEIFARTMIEAQSWQGPEDAAGEDTGLIGYGFAVGLAR